MSHIFISYNRQQRTYVDQLAQTFKDYQFQYWFDKHINPGDNWEDTLVDKVKSAAAIVVVMTPEAAESVGVERENPDSAETQETDISYLVGG